MRPSRKLLWAFLPLSAAALLLTRTGATIYAADVPATKPAKAQKYVTYQFGTAQWLNPGHSITASQGVTFGQDDAFLKTDAAIALLDKDQHLLSAEAQAPVHLYDTQDDLTGLHGSIDFTNHVAKLTDNIVLRVTPGKRETGAPPGSPRRQFKDPATLTCAAITYNYQRKIGRIPGPLTVRQIIQQKDGTLIRTLTADAGIYNGRNETIRLVGTVRGQDSDGNIIQADTRASGKAVVIGIKEGAEYITVPFRTDGHFQVKPQEDTNADSGDALDELPPVPPAATSLPPAVKPSDSAPPTAPPADTTHNDTTRTDTTSPPPRPAGTANP